MIGNQGDAPDLGPEPKPPFGFVHARLREWILPAFLAIASFGIAVSQRAASLTTWDSALFALAIRDYDLLESRPHAPGYPLYVALGKAVTATTHDANLALVLISAAAGAVSITLLFGLARQLVAFPLALVATILWAAAPILRHNQTYAATYSLEAMFSIALAWLCWTQLEKPSVGRSGRLGMLLALAVGFRPSLLIFLGPLVVFASVRGPSGKFASRQAAAFLRWGTAVGLCWFVPMLVFGGGGHAWWRSNAVVAGAILSGGGSGGFVSNAFAQFDIVRTWPTQVTALAFTATLVFASMALVNRTTRSLRIGLHEVRGRFAVVLGWIGPSVLFFVLVFAVGPAGYALVFLPGILLSLALLGEAAWSSIAPGPPRQAWKAVVVALLLLPLGPFLLAHENVEPNVAAQDRRTDQWRTAMRAFPVNETAIVAGPSCVNIRYYFPEFLIWCVSYRFDESGTMAFRGVLQIQDDQADVPVYEVDYGTPMRNLHPIPDNIAHLVVIDAHVVDPNWSTSEASRSNQSRQTAEGLLVIDLQGSARRATIEDYFLALPQST